MRYQDLGNAAAAAHDAANEAYDGGGTCVGSLDRSGLGPNRVDMACLIMWGR